MMASPWPPPEDGPKWYYNEEARAVLHDSAADCNVCMYWYHHYTSDVYPVFNETLKMACAERDARDKAWQSEIDTAKQMRDTAVQQLADISRELRIARAKLHAARQKRADAQVTAYHRQDGILSGAHEVISKLHHPPAKGTSHVPSRQPSPRRKQQAQDQDYDNDGIWFISAPTSTATSGPQANVPGTSSHLLGSSSSDHCRDPRCAPPFSFCSSP